MSTFRRTKLLCSNFPSFFPFLPQIFECLLNASYYVITEDVAGIKTDMFATLTFWWGD